MSDWGRIYTRTIQLHELLGKPVPMDVPNMSSKELADLNKRLEEELRNS